MGKRRDVYNSRSEPAYIDCPTDVSDLVQESSYGGIDLASDDFYLIHALPLGIHLLLGLAVHLNPLSSPISSIRTSKVLQKG